MLCVISNKLVNAVHDISSGGILITLSEMCISGKIGVNIELPRSKISIHEYLFGEDQSRYLIEVKEENHDKVCNILKENSIYFDKIGKTQKDNLDIDKILSVKITELDKLNSFWFRDYFKEN